MNTAPHVAPDTPETDVVREDNLLEQCVDGIKQDAAVQADTYVNNVVVPEGGE